MTCFQYWLQGCRVQRPVIAETSVDLSRRPTVSRPSQNKHGRLWRLKKRPQRGVSHIGRRDCTPLPRTGRIRTMSQRIT